MVDYAVREGVLSPPSTPEFLFFYFLQARLYSLQSDPATYCNEPDGEGVAVRGRLAGKGDHGNLG